MTHNTWGMADKWDRLLCQTHMQLIQHVNTFSVLTSSYHHAFSVSQTDQIRHGKDVKDVRGDRQWLYWNSSSRNDTDHCVWHQVRLTPNTLEILNTFQKKVFKHTLRDFFVSWQHIHNRWQENSQSMSIFYRHTTFTNDHAWLFQT